MSWLSAFVPFGVVEQAAQRLAGLTLPASSVWDQVQKQGERLEQARLHQQEQVSYERVVLAAAGSAEGQVKSVSMDGGMVHIRGMGWKEFKVGSVSQVEVGHTAGEEGVRLCQTGYTAVLGEVQAFAPALWALAVREGVPCAERSAVVADGAAWIWGLVGDYFPDSRQIVDWYHAKQHLVEASQALYGSDTKRAEGWCQERETHLYQGQIEPILADLEGAGLKEKQSYFATHKRRMQYLEFREEGWPIGSGVVESGVKQLKGRLAGAGMRWSWAGAQRLLTIRAAIMSDRFEQVWAVA